LALLGFTGGFADDHDPGRDRTIRSDVHFKAPSLFTASP
jgi:hypothetical protein